MTLTLAQRYAAKLGGRPKKPKRALRLPNEKLSD